MLLQFIWEQQLFSSRNFVTTDNKNVEILSAGLLNRNAGPDFLNSKIKIDNTIWAGNIEIHINSSDWYKHKHHENKQYKNVILHVVVNHDKEVYLNETESIPTIKIVVPEVLQQKYSEMMKSSNVIKCNNYLKEIDPIYVLSYLDTLTSERIKNKTDYLDLLLSQTNQNWEKSFYLLLARHFGFKVNAYPFEKLAESIPLEHFAKIKNSLFKIEALLFGQSGLLDELTDDYTRNLHAEYTMLQKKCMVTPIDKSLWKFSKLRPYNFPTIRIAQFAYLIYHSQHLLSKIIETESIEALHSLFEISTSDYWTDHFQFGKQSKKEKKNASSDTKNSLLINVVVPTLFLYGRKKGNEQLTQRAIQLLEQIHAEKNSITRSWGEVGVIASNAAQSQALIELHNNYCLTGKCLQCRIGKIYLRRVVYGA